MSKIKEIIAGGLIAAATLVPVTSAQERQGNAGAQTAGQNASVGDKEVDGILAAIASGKNVQDLTEAQRTTLRAKSRSMNQETFGDGTTSMINIHDGVITAWRSVGKQPGDDRNRSEKAGYSAPEGSQINTEAKAFFAATSQPIGPSGGVKPDNSPEIRAARGAQNRQAEIITQKIKSGKKVQDLTADEQALIRGDQKTYERYFPGVSPSQRDSLGNTATGLNITDKIHIDVSDKGVITASRFNEQKQEWERAGYSAPAGQRMTEDQAFGSAKTGVSGNNPRAQSMRTR